MFKIDDKDVDEFEAHLKTFGRRAFPFATKATLNSAAFKTRELAQKDIRVKMITRNKFTEKSVLVEQSRTLTVSRQSATVGSIADYMADQEFGATQRKKGEHGVALPTAYSAGQDGQQQRTKLPRKPNKLSNIRLRKGKNKVKNKKQELLLKVMDAVKTGKRYIFHDFGGGKSKGIFRVIGGSRSVKRGWPRGATIRMVYDLSKPSVTIPRNPWLKPAVNRTQVLMPDMYEKALRFQLKRLGLFK